jgi:hypothetical protein
MAPPIILYQLNFIILISIYIFFNGDTTSQPPVLISTQIHRKNYWMN